MSSLYVDMCVLLEFHVCTVCMLICIYTVLCTDLPLQLHQFLSQAYQYLEPVMNVQCYIHLQNMHVWNYTDTYVVHICV